MTDVDHIFQAIRGLPVRERLRLVEREVHDLAEVSWNADQVEPTPAAGPSRCFDSAQLHAVIDDGLAASDDEGIEAEELIAELRSRG